MEYLTEENMNTRNFTADERRRYYARLEVETDTNPPPTPNWTHEAFIAEFDTIGFAAPYVQARSKENGKLYIFTFKHNPRIYFNQQEA